VFQINRADRVFPRFYSPQIAQCGVIEGFIPLLILLSFSNFHMDLHDSRQSSAPTRTFGPVEDDTERADHTSRRLSAKISFGRLKLGRPSFAFSRGNNSQISVQGAERPPIPTMIHSSGEVYSTPLPKLSMIVLSIVGLTRGI